ncbi:MAG: signal peptide peptidase SppA [Methanomicrobiaceae archaeon]|nr:signal peptide peptidase SppA [Methanomicrobiaceae archaeon]
MAWLDDEARRIQSRAKGKKRRKLIAALAVVLVIIVGLAIAGLLVTYADERKITVIRIEGTMVTGNFYGDGYVGSEFVGMELRRAADDPLVEAIVLRVNSPGGSPAAAQEIIRDLEYARTRKPVVVSMGDMAASAAYYVSSHADRIYASPDTITGSIGTAWTFYDLSDYLEEEGIGVDVVKSGSKKDMTSGYRPLTDEERAYAQEIVDQSYEAFVADVVAQREVSRDILEDARIFRGEEARAVGLIDDLGNLYDAIEGAQVLAGTARSSLSAVLS